jgi:ring-1,2-phenylacetyl-CoA epoxidase subunit PaaD
MNTDPTLAPAWAALATVKDPCLVAAGFALSIVDLGLVRGLAIEDGRINVKMTFTEPGCQFTHRVIVDVEAALEAAGFGSVSIQPVWDPIWTEEALSPEARREFTTARTCMTQSLTRRQAQRPT